MGEREKLAVLRMIVEVVFSESSREPGKIRLFYEVNRGSGPVMVRQTLTPLNAKVFEGTRRTMLTELNKLSGKDLGGFDVVADKSRTLLMSYNLRGDLRYTNLRGTMVEVILKDGLIPPKYIYRWTEAGDDGREWEKVEICGNDKEELKVERMSVVVVDGMKDEPVLKLTYTCVGGKKVVEFLSLLHEEELPGLRAKALNRLNSLSSSGVLEEFSVKRSDEGLLLWYVFEGDNMYSNLKDDTIRRVLTYNLRKPTLINRWYVDGIQQIEIMR